MRRWGSTHCWRVVRLLVGVAACLLYRRTFSNTAGGLDTKPLILIWNGYQEDDRLWDTVFLRVTSGQCRAQCDVTRDRARLNESSAIVFHLPNLHWEGYDFPGHRDPRVPWVLMSYESANSIRERAGNWGRYPPLTAKHLRAQFNRTLTLRRDSDLVARHGAVRRRQTPLTEQQVETLYSQDPPADFSNYTEGWTCGALVSDVN